MRISEVINLEIDQIHSTQYFVDGEVKKIKVATLNPSDTKSGQGRVIPFNYDAVAAIDEALALNKGKHTSKYSRVPTESPLAPLREYIKHSYAPVNHSA